MEGSKFDFEYLEEEKISELSQYKKKYLKNGTVKAQVVSKKAEDPLWMEKCAIHAEAYLMNEKVDINSIKNLYEFFREKEIRNEAIQFGILVVVLKNIGIDYFKIKEPEDLEKAIEELDDEGFDRFKGFEQQIIGAFNRRGNILKNSGLYSNKQFDVHGRVKKESNKRKSVDADDKAGVQLDSVNDSEWSIYNGMNMKEYMKMAADYLKEKAISELDDDTYHRVRDEVQKQEEDMARKVNLHCGLAGLVLNRKGLKYKTFDNINEIMEYIKDFDSASVAAFADILFSDGANYEIPMDDICKWCHALCEEARKRRRAELDKAKHLSDTKQEDEKEPQQTVLTTTEPDDEKEPQQTVHATAEPKVSRVEPSVTNSTKNNIDIVNASIKEILEYVMNSEDKGKTAFEIYTKIPYSSNPNNSNSIDRGNLKEKRELLHKVCDIFGMSNDEKDKKLSDEEIFKICDNYNKFTEKKSLKSLRRFLKHEKPEFIEKYFIPYFEVMSYKDNVDKTEMKNNIEMIRAMGNENRNIPNAIKHIQKSWKKVAAFGIAVLAAIGTAAYAITHKQTAQLKLALEKKTAISDVDNKKDINKADSRNQTWLMSEAEMSEYMRNLIHAYDDNKEQDSSTQTEKKDIVVSLGDEIKLPANQKYQEGIDGGRVGYVGTTVSPSDGTYMIDRYCKVENGKITNVAYTGEKDEIGDDAQWVHISLLDENGNRLPRGWVLRSQVTDNLQKQQENNEQER